MTSNQLSPGNTKRFDCLECNREFEITLEPKCKGKPDLASGISDADVTYCPFCAGYMPSEED